MLDKLQPLNCRDDPLQYVITSFSYIKSQNATNVVGEMHI